MESVRESMNQILRPSQVDEIDRRFDAVSSGDAPDGAFVIDLDREQQKTVEEIVNDLYYTYSPKYQPVIEKTAIENRFFPRVTSSAEKEAEKAPKFAGGGVA